MWTGTASVAAPAGETATCNGLFKHFTPLTPCHPPPKTTPFCHPSFPSGPHSPSLPLAPWPERSRGYWRTEKPTTHHPRRPEPARLRPDRLRRLLHLAQYHTLKKQCRVFNISPHHLHTMTPQRTTQPVFRVECKVHQDWVLLSEEPSKESAERVASFMRLAQPGPGSVRVIETHTAHTP